MCAAILGAVPLQRLVLVDRMREEQAPFSTCKECSHCPRIPLPVHTGGGEQHIDMGRAAQNNGERHGVGPAHPDFLSVVGVWWYLSH